VLPRALHLHTGSLTERSSGRHPPAPGRACIRCIHATMLVHGLLLRMHVLMLGGMSGIRRHLRHCYTGPKLPHMSYTTPIVHTTQSSRRPSRPQCTIHCHSVHLPHGTPHEVALGHRRITTRWRSLRSTRTAVRHICSPSFHSR